MGWGELEIKNEIIKEFVTKNRQRESRAEEQKEKKERETKFMRESRRGETKADKIRASMCVCSGRDEMQIELEIG